MDVKSVSCQQIMSMCPKKNHRRAALLACGRAADRTEAARVWRRVLTLGVEGG